MGLTWRHPGPTDAEALGRLHHRSWVDTYGAVAPEGWFDEHDEAWSIDRWRGHLGQPPPPGCTRLAVVDDSGAAVAWALGGPRPDDDAQPPGGRPLRLWAIYLAPSHQGTGLAQALVRRVIGDQPAEVWVWAGNERAIAFYRRLGFRADGATAVDERFPWLPEIRMVR